MVAVGAGVGWIDASDSAGSLDAFATLVAILVLTHGCACLHGAKERTGRQARATLCRFAVGSRVEKEAVTSALG